MGQKAKTEGGGGNGEKAEESRQRPLSRQETSWVRSKKIICVGEKRYHEPGRLIGALTDIFSMCTITTNRGTAKLWLLPAKIRRANCIFKKNAICLHLSVSKNKPKGTKVSAHCGAKVQQLTFKENRELQTHRQALLQH